MATGVDARLLKSTRFPPEFSQKVDMQKVNLQVMKKWIASKISDILGSEDDVVIELVFNLIEGPRYPDIKSLQIQLTGFLDKDTAVFCKDLWKLLLSAQSSPQGVPKELLEAKKLELIQEKIEADRAAETAKQRRDDWDRRDREVADLKDRDRRDRAAARGDTWQGRRGDRDFENRGRGGFRRGGRRSRSPGPRFRDARDTYGRDSYIPRGRRGGGRADQGRRKSPLRSRSESASPRPSSRSRSASRSTDQSNQRRRPVSPGGQADTRKRSRSPRGDTYRGRANKRTERDRPARPSRSLSSERNSPAPKRRRYSSSRSRSTPVVEVEVAVIAALAAVPVARHRTAGPKDDRIMDVVASSPPGREIRLRVDGEIVLQLLRDEGFEKIQLMFLKMDLVPCRPNPRQRFRPNEVSEI
ncbi:hypothetical protein BFJ66_g1535 [Fusarium oxysporum f. sp. cepae]|uniref:PWI domain-containing protein n=1 Tax=Fusarium oxysporum f. sp. cepae TaxID=396571 RepID=A0A3L6P8D3_FUSOX|nr:hypothetical protein BFJ65_g2027 [Fusarium oxysporum f. sp. cepae]RKK60930.1 hypothetical protein BFJ66_g1535 [Fusarium oxysporum f. sp. cepae]RKK62784.1 hypothetical protein BFJ67_g1223 [Fusarium oxysporum f. sp. cepae]